MIDMTFPNSEASELAWTLPYFNYRMSVSLPGAYYSSIFYLGLGTLALFASRKLVRIYQRTKSYFKSFGNASKYETSKSSSGKTYTAVIYGAATTLGKMYSHYLASKGFNLILIERDMEQLKNLEAYLSSELLVPVKVTKICIDKFD